MITACILLGASLVGMAVCVRVIAWAMSIGDGDDRVPIAFFAFILIGAMTVLAFGKAVERVKEVEDRAAIRAATP